MHCVKTVGRDYLDSKLPKLYYGIVRRQCMLDLKRECGEYFPGPSPDIAGAIAISKYVNKIKFIEKNFKNKSVLIEKPLFSKPTKINLKNNKYYVGYNLRFKVRPGITGLAAINGFRGGTNNLELMQKRIDLDLSYDEKNTFTRLEEQVYKM